MMILLSFFVLMLQLNNNLTKSYRSTKEISAFTQGLLPKTQQIEIIEGDGREWSLRLKVSLKIQLRRITEYYWIHKCPEKQCKPIAVIL